ncbi:hydrogen gas-evolving membrane-bound hydrogenase subunit E [Candidatus Latescibacterota bacterium]
MILLYGLMIFMIIGAVIAIETKDLLSSVISVGAMGMALSIIFLILGAPDLAIVQVAVEVIALIMLIRLIVIREDVTVAHRYRHGEIFATATGLVFAGIFIVFASIAYKEMPVFGNPLLRVSQQYISEGFSISNAGNIVSAILLEFRAYDTLGEATVIFTSIVGAIVILRKKGRRDT